MRYRTYLSIAGLMVLIVTLGFYVTIVYASGPASTVGVEKKMLSAVSGNDACLTCHQNPGFNVTIGTPQKKEVFPLSVDPIEYGHSVHGEIGLTCLECHIDFEPTMGHGISFPDRRAATISLNKACAVCHKNQADKEVDSVHSKVRSFGKFDAAVCTDCHSAHAVQRIKDPKTGALMPATRKWIPTTCEKCHSAIYEKYRNSVHGTALTDENNPDVPTCIDCHGVHNIGDPTTNAFRLQSPQMCAKCHTDPQRMDKYGISTQVMNTYVSDFHGTTVSIFEQVSPDAATNKPVCYDCHGIHDIPRTDDPTKGLLIKANLLMKCQKCHPSADMKFPDAWMSHYIPSPDKYPIVYYINLFYKFLIPGVLVPMGVLVLMDFSRAMINRFSKPKKPILKKPSEPTETTASADEEAHNG